MVRYKILCTIFAAVIILTPIPAGAATPLPWVEVKKEVNTTATPGRPRLYVTIAPTGDQSRAGQAELAATAMEAAVKYQEFSKAPVVVVNMICQRAANEWGENQLATASFIPDGKGYNGEQKLGPWDMVRAAPRGFTAQELEYLRLWAEMRGQYQGKGGTDEEALDTAISKKMGLKPESMELYLNYPQPVEQPPK